MQFLSPVMRISFFLFCMLFVTPLFSEKKWTADPKEKVKIEAEDGEITASFKVYTDENDSKIKYLAAKSGKNGKALYIIHAKKAGKYAMHCTVKCASGKNDSVYISVNNGTKYVIDFRPRPKWSFLNKLTIRTDKDPKTRMPLILDLKEGDNTILITPRELDARVDYFIIEAAK